MLFEKGNKVRVKTSFNDSCPSYYLKIKDKIGVVVGIDFQNIEKSVVQFPDEKYLGSIIDFHLELVSNAEDFILGIKQ